MFACFLFDSFPGETLQALFAEMNHEPQQTCHIEEVTDGAQLGGKTMLVTQSLSITNNSSTATSEEEKQEAKRKTIQKSLYTVVTVLNTLYNLLNL